MTVAPKSFLDEKSLSQAMSRKPTKKRNWTVKGSITTIVNQHINLVGFGSWEEDNMRQHYCLTSALTWSLRIDWDMAGHNRNWPISKPSRELAARMAVIGCQPRSSNRFLETKVVHWTQWLKGLMLHIIYPPCSYVWFFGYFGSRTCI